MLLDQVKDSLRRSLQIGAQVDTFTENTRLLGNLPELDSMAVVTVITDLEEYFGIVIDDDDVSADTFESVGALMKLVSEKLDPVS